MIAAAYNGSASFDRVTSACDTNDAEQLGCSTAIAELHRGKQRTASSYRAGASIAPVSPLTIAAEVVRRGYSAYADEPYSIINTTEVLPYHDVTELHAGAEYRLGKLALRGGWWRDPARFNDQQFAPYAPWARSASHVTFGAGLKLANAEVSFAVDDPRNDNQRRTSIGMTYSF